MTNFKKMALAIVAQLPNHEFPGLVGEIAKKVKETELGETQVRLALNRLSANSDELGLVKEGTKSHPLTKAINERTQNRREFLTSIRDVAKAKQRSSNADERKDAKIVTNWLNDYKGKLGVGRAQYQNNIVNGLSTTYNVSVEIQDALDGLGLKEQFDEIQAETEIIISDIIKRADDLAERKKKIATIRQQCSKDAIVLLRAIENEAYLDSSEGRVFVKLFNSVNEILGRYRTRYKISKANRKNTEKIKDELEIEPSLPELKS